MENYTFKKMVLALFLFRFQRKTLITACFLSCVSSPKTLYNLKTKGSAAWTGNIWKKTAISYKLVQFLGKKCKLFSNHMKSFCRQHTRCYAKF